MAVMQTVMQRIKEDVEKDRQSLQKHHWGARRCLRADP